MEPFVGIGVSWYRPFDGIDVMDPDDLIDRVIEYTKKNEVPDEDFVKTPCMTPYKVEKWETPPSMP